MKPAVFIGLDLGTQGLRGAALSEEGEQLATAHIGWGLTAAATSPALWWDACRRVLTSLLKTLREQGHTAGCLRALSVCSTSGSVLLCDKGGNPLGAALLYNDRRAELQARELGEHHGASLQELGLSPTPSAGLPKLLWFKQNRPDLWSKAAWIMHPADYLVGRLSGRYGYTDITHALKSGYDVRRKRWSLPVLAEFRDDMAKFPQVVDSGTIVSPLRPVLAETLGLPEDLSIVVGMTDGCAAPLGLGLVRASQAVGELGSTLVVKTVWHQFKADTAKGLYSHRYADSWLVGGASNSGGRPLSQRFGEDLKHWDAQAACLEPTGQVCYPLPGTGERFPFVNPKAQTIEPLSVAPETLYRSYLEGVAYIERFCYEHLQIQGLSPQHFYGGGKGSSSDIWCRIRASVLGAPLHRYRGSSVALGACILAAAPFMGGIVPAAKRLAPALESIEPHGGWLSAYEEGYGRFKEVLRERGYLDT